MKNILKRSLGGVSILVLFYLAGVHATSCNSRKTNHPPILHVIYDTTGSSGGSSSGGGLKTVIRCFGLNCVVIGGNDSSNVAPGTQKLVFSLTAENDIPANTNFKLVIYQSQDSMRSPITSQAK